MVNFCDWEIELESWSQKLCSGFLGCVFRLVAYLVDLVLLDEMNYLNFE